MFSIILFTFAACLAKKILFFRELCIHYCVIPYGFDLNCAPMCDFNVVCIEEGRSLGRTVTGSTVSSLPSLHCVNTD